jgi:hypothetical protein
MRTRSVDWGRRRTEAETVVLFYELKYHESLGRGATMLPQSAGPMPYARKDKLKSLCP